MHLLRAGNDINMVSYWLGHADINTTHIYVEIDMETKRKMIDRAGAPTISKKAHGNSRKFFSGSINLPGAVNYVQ